jgi:hypothetical protein
VDAVILEIVAAGHKIPVEPVSPVKLREHVFIRIENQAEADAG